MTGRSIKRKHDILSFWTLHVSAHYCDICDNVTAAGEACTTSLMWDWSCPHLISPRCTHDQLPPLVRAFVPMWHCLNPTHCYHGNQSRERMGYKWEIVRGHDPYYVWHSRMHDIMFSVLIMTGWVYQQNIIASMEILHNIIYGIKLQILTST